MARTLVARTGVLARVLVSGRSVAPAYVDPPPVPPDPDPGPAAPVISNVTVIAKTDTSATIRWELDQSGSGQVNYGLTAGYGSNSTNQACCQYNFHVQTITGLTAGTLYHYRVRSTNVASQETVGSDLTFTTNAAPADPPDYPAVTDPLVASNPAYDTAAAPAYLATHACSGLSTVVRRVSNISLSMNGYAKRSAWNSDESLMMLSSGSANRAILNGSTYAIVSADQPFANSAVWWHSDPLRLWLPNSARTGVYLNMTINPVTGVITAGSLTTPTALSGSYTVFDPGGNEQDSCADDSVMAFSWRKSDATWGIGVLTRSTGVVAAELQLGTGAAAGLSGLNAKIDFCQISDDAAWVAYGCPNTGSGVTRGVWTLPVSLSTATRTNATTGLQHVDWARAADGTPRLICWNSAIISHNPSGGGQVTLIASSSGGTHVSGRNWKWPGWVFVTEYSGGTGGVLRNKVVALQIDDPGAGRVFSFSHRIAGTDHNDYDNSMKGCPSPTGTRVVYNGRWESLTGSIYAWVSGVAA